MSEINSQSEVLQIALTALDAAQFSKARKFAIQASEESPKEALPQVVLGIACSRLRLKDEATSAFEKAIVLEPENGKPYYNFAAHLYEVGEKELALEMAISSYERDNRSDDARMLAVKICNDLGIEIPESIAKAGRAGPFQTLEELSFSSSNIHSLPWIPKLEPYWTIAGLIISTVSFIAFAVIFKTFLPLLIRGATTGQNIVAPHSGLLTVVGILGWSSFITGPIFLFLDVLDRRNNFLWMFPMTILSCAGLGWLVLPLYLLVSRRK